MRRKTGKSDKIYHNSRSVFLQTRQNIIRIKGATIKSNIHQSVLLDVFIYFSPFVNRKGRRQASLSALGDGDDLVPRVVRSRAVRLVGGADLVVADDVVSVELEVHAVNLLESQSDVLDELASGLSLGGGEATVAVLPETFVLDTDSVPVRVHTTASDNGGGGFAGLRGADALAPRSVLERDQLRDLTLLRDDKVARRLSIRIAEPGDSTRVAALGDVADDDIGLPAVALTSVRARALSDGEAELRGLGRARGSSSVARSRSSAACAAGFAEVLRRAISAIAQLSPAVADGDDTNGGASAHSLDLGVVSASALSDVQTGGGLVVGAGGLGRRRALAGLLSVAIADALIFARAAVVCSSTAITPVRAALAGLASGGAALSRSGNRDKGENSKNSTHFLFQRLIFSDVSSNF